ncbi:hypothetical protein F5Y16DRAFT_53651 [Xylariaceae sp. FL0255]|nr:hypothetical protein F5Y16DRAFT_53651 [Xylariaceae sp. FL0255]
MDKIPAEVLLEVFDYLAGPAPSTERLHHQPHPDLFAARVFESPRPLQSVSLVSKSWRTLSLPALFRHVHWQPSIQSLSHFTLNPIPLLDFLKKNNLVHYVETFTLSTDYVDPVVINQGLTPQIRSVDLDWLWTTLFSVVDPLRFMLMAPPSTLAALTSRRLDIDDNWCFEHPYTIISMSRASRDATDRVEQDDTPVESTAVKATTSYTAQPEGRVRSALVNRYLTPRPKGPPLCLLFSLRPWTSLLLNEGSFIPAYRNYDYGERKPPSMLVPLIGSHGLGANARTKGLIPPTVVDFSYVAVFPHATHVMQLFENLPPIERLFIQITPGPENKVFKDARAMRDVESRDLWEERDSIQGKLLIPEVHEQSLDNWNSLRVFESGDLVSIAIWHKILLTPPRGWNITSQGVMTLNPVKSERADDRDPDIDDMDSDPDDDFWNFTWEV